MSTVIMVPVHLDGFFLTQEKLVTEAFANFSDLPYAGTDEDYNPDTANISESILSHPFQNTNLNLEKGMHLHWSLPDALTKGNTGGTVVDYFAVPNRWLVKRSSTTLGDAQWVVESDYMHSGLENPYGSIAYPADANVLPDQPFCYLGRRLEGTGWTEVSATRLPKLTAMGYGEPAFAAFYPNCHSVFGCFDPDIDTESSLQGLSYQLIGWYSNTTQDPLADFLTTYIADNPGASQDTLKQAIKDQFAWNVDTTIDTNNVPNMVCYADLTFEVAPNADLNNTRKSDDAISLSIGNTGTEALSAYLASRVNANNSIQLEEQLEHLLMQTQLQSGELDLGARFKETRHEKGFKAVKGGSLWEIKPVNKNSDTANESNDITSVAIGLPSTMSDALDELNGLQQEADRAEETLDVQRQILFADWYKYMLCAYPPDGSGNNHPDIDYVKWYIENQTIPWVEAAETDLTDKQDALTAPKAALEAQLNDFNNSTISKEIFFRDLTAVATSDSEITFTNDSWENNDPFSNQCMALNGTDAKLSIAGTAIDGTKALSLWVNLATAQNNDNPVLLATANSEALIAKGETTGFWDKISINGLTQPYYQAFQWSSLPKDQWFHLYIEFTEALTSSDTLYLFSNNSTQFLGGKLAAVRLFTDTLSADELYYDQNMLGHEWYEFKEAAAPRFWQPAEPVVLIEGNAVEPTLRHGQDGRLNQDDTLDCPGTDVTNYPLLEGNFSELLTTITAGAPTIGEEKIGYDTWSEQPWHPFLLEWEVELFPMEEGGNLDIDNRDFNTNFITTNYTLEENSPELSVKSGKSVISAAAIYSGRTILTPYAKKQLTQTIVSYLSNLQQQDCYQVIGSITDTEKSTYTTALTTWYNTKPDWLDTTIKVNVGILTTLAELADPETGAVGWTISWDTGEGFIASVTVSGNTTTIVVEDDQGVIIETFTVVDGISVTDSSTNTIANPDATILLTGSEDCGNYHSWYLNKPVQNNGTEQTFSTVFTTKSEKRDNFNYSIIEAYNTLVGGHFISQALSGFNNALLMHHQTLQLPISDPLGFDDYQTFATKVATAIGDNNNVAPLPFNDFLPVRSGTMQLLSLRIIDSFGQLKTLDHTSPVKAETIALPKATGGAAVNGTKSTDMWLPPRFVQPARINFRWLSADSGSQEFNSFPESSPVCGWLLANHLDNSVAVYDSQGNALGIIDQEAEWRNVPGTDAAVSPSDFDNEYLQKVIERLALIDGEADPGSVKKTFLEDFISVTDKALENIDPESFAHHQELALLMGRPIAVVRASLNLELQGGPAIHYGWTEFYQDLERTTRETNSFEAVSLPIRVGERGQLNDGVLGYWKENASNALETEFHTTVDLTSVTISSSTIEGYQASQPDITQSLGSDPQLLTLLIDPRGEVHATTGMLPAKSINIPKEYYTDALKKINITFLTAPVLSAVDQIALPLPNELGYRWSWLAKDRYSWTETANTGILRKDSLISAFDDGDDLWTELLNKGWITERDGNLADIVSTDQRTSATLGTAFEAQTDAIEAFLDTGHIVAVNTKAVFIPDQTIKEGWLKLSPSDN